MMTMTGNISADGVRQRQLWTMSSALLSSVCIGYSGLLCVCTRLYFALPLSRQSSGALVLDPRGPSLLARHSFALLSCQAGCNQSYPLRCFLLNLFPR